MSNKSRNTRTSNKSEKDVIDEIKPIPYENPSKLKETPAKVAEVEVEKPKETPAKVAEVEVEKPKETPVKEVEKPKPESRKSISPTLVKRVSAMSTKITFFKIAVNAKTSEFLGIGAFSQPHHELQVQKSFEEDFGIPVKLLQPASLQLTSDDIEAITELLRTIPISEIDMIAYNTAFGRVNNNSEISTTINLS